ncbi:MAG TPA: hypothetical protein VGX25_04870 [Actinophytocola sp.]|uniref:hypothetical protein n=1 Tax=Actinophytocola sp. TaxID=1872138 RepID=UPI002DDD5330|nr:hypothetical protein [Actinophytocola sp.]HEV2778714.1 hypothetical protein [Actinophytocola sp.]
MPTAAEVAIAAPATAVFTVASQEAVATLVSAAAAARATPAGTVVEPADVAR